MPYQIGPSTTFNDVLLCEVVTVFVFLLVFFPYTFNLFAIPLR